MYYDQYMLVSSNYARCTDSIAADLHKISNIKWQEVIPQHRRASTFSVLKGPICYTSYFVSQSVDYAISDNMGF